MEIKLSTIYKRIKENGIEETYNSLLLDKPNDIAEDSMIKLLSLAAILMKREETEYKKLAYYIILKYSILSGDYNPLYEMSYDLFNIPVIELLDKINNTDEEGIYAEIYDILKSRCEKNGNFYTLKQEQMRKNFFEKDIETAVVAPTSFGKTELIKEYIMENYEYKNICVLVPSKAMINQLKYDIINMFGSMEEKPQVITHYDIAIKENKRNIFIFTQERLFKFVYDKKTNIIFDTLLIDEAHRLFEKDDRDKLLARIIILLKNRNDKIVIKYFSPVIKDIKNINFKYLNEEYNINNPIIVQPLIKVEEFSYMDYLDKEKKIYDQFFNRFIYSENVYKDEYDYMIRESKNKNIIYLNKPRECIEKATRLSEKFEINMNLEIASQTLKKFIHNDYDLSELIKKGIIYHNGIVPENVRLYLENIIKTDNKNDIKYVFATSTLLEGVNMPFDAMFIFDISKGKQNMKYQDLKNLIGRVNRYSLIFNLENNKIEKLLPQIHFVRTADKTNKNFEKFIVDNLKVESKSNNRNDVVNNPLLQKGEDTDSNEKNIIENLENKTNENNEISTEVGKLCLENNITEFDIKINEKKIEQNISKIKENEEELSIINLIYKIFVENIEFINNSQELKRLENIQAKQFYDVFLNWKKNNYTYNEMINIMVNYWNKNNIEYVYLGSSWGECKRYYTDRLNNYVKLTQKTKEEKVNYAIKKIKIENDFVEYKLIKFIEILYKVDLVSKEEYYKIKYGTDNEIQIYFQKEGLSQELSKKLVEKYSDYIYEKEKEEYGIKKDIFDNFEENDILRVELKYYI